MAVTLIVLPAAFIVVFAGVDHLTGAKFHAAHPLTRVYGAILVAEFTMAVAHAIFPVAVVLDALALIDVLAFTVAKTVENVTFVGALIRPSICALACDLVLLESAVIDRAVCPLERSTSPE